MRFGRLHYFGMWLQQFCLPRSLYTYKERYACTFPSPSRIFITASKPLAFRYPCARPINSPIKRRLLFYIAVLLAWRAGWKKVSAAARKAPWEQLQIIVIWRELAVWVEGDWELDHVNVSRKAVAVPRRVWSDSMSFLSIRAAISQPFGSGSQ